ncbi:LOW QUALITY PROTEIN: uncharacterized protein [Manis javanica]|uniref:LOW QUALITY PROTEIN: uncharacterized protein n=1 Tax=Manis javanica TaxID=9974 RepID=UPI003C6D48DA
MSYNRPPPKVDSMTSLKVNNLNYNTSPTTLWRVFRKYGSVGDVYIPRNRLTKKSQGFAFVRFHSKCHAVIAANAVNGIILDGRKLRVQMALYGRARGPQHGRTGAGAGAGARARARARPRAGARARRGRSQSRCRSRSRYQSRYQSRSRSWRSWRSWSRSRYRSQSQYRSQSRYQSRSRSQCQSRCQSRSRYQSRYQSQSRRSRGPSQYRSRSRSQCQSRCQRRSRHQSHHQYQSRSRYASRFSHVKSPPCSSGRSPPISTSSSTQTSRSNYSSVSRSPSPSSSRSRSRSLPPKTKPNRALQTEQTDDPTTFEESNSWLSIDLAQFILYDDDESRGLPKAQIDNLPVRSFRKNYTETSCCISTSDYKEGTKFHILPCSHSFHIYCIDRWLAEKCTCPVCRREVADAGER